jgi:hypothetical protein
VTLVGDPFRLHLINVIPKTTGDRSNMFVKMQAGTCLVPIDPVESENIKNIRHHWVSCFYYVV